MVDSSNSTNSEDSKKEEKNMADSDIIDKTNNNKVGASRRT